MGNFLGDLGAAFRGQQDYQTFLNKQEEMKLRIQAEKLNLAEIQDLSEQKKKQRARDPDVAAGFMDYLTGQQPQNIPPPPMPAAPPPQAPVPPPAPGQQSVPMTHPRQIGPDSGMPSGGPPMGTPPQGGPVMPHGGPQMPPGAPPGPPPYQTVGGPPMAAQGPQGIPPPPMQPGQPRPNSMSLQDAARFIKQRGITDPETSLQILEKLTPYLNNEAKQEAGMLKMQLAQQEKTAALTEKGREADQRSNDYKLSVEERRAAAKEAVETRKMLGLMMGGIAQQNANTRKAAASSGNGSNGLTEGGMRVQEELARAGKPIPKGRRGEINVALLNSLAEHEEGGAGSGGLAGAMADYKATASTYGAIQKRSAGIELGVKKIEKDINLLKSTMEKGNAGFATVINEPINYLRRKGSDKALAAYSLAAENVAVEFERLRSGGMLSAAQLHAGAQEDAKKIINGEMSVGETLEKLPVMLQEIQNGREAAQETEKYYRDELHGKKQSSGDPIKIKDAADYAKLKSGEEYITPDGQHKRKP